MVQTLPSCSVYLKTTTKKKKKNHGEGNQKSENGSADVMLLHITVNSTEEFCVKLSKKMYATWEFFPYIQNIQANRRFHRSYNLDVLEITGLLKVHKFLYSSKVTGLLFQGIHSPSLKQPSFLLLHATVGVEGEDIFVLFQGEVQIPQKTLQPPPHQCLKHKKG